MTARRDGNFLEKDKIITSFKANDYVEVKASGNFSKLLVVKINQAFELSCRMISRKSVKFDPPIEAINQINRDALIVERLWPQRAFRVRTQDLTDANF